MMRFRDGKEWRDSSPEQIIGHLKSKHGRVRLDLGCGFKVHPGFVGIDKTPESLADVVWDFEDGFPFPPDTVDEVLGNQFLEHLSRGVLIRFMNELWEALVPGGKAEFFVPYFRSEWAFADPTHRNWFSLKSFTYFVGEVEPRLCDLYGIRHWFHLELLELTKGDEEIHVVLRKPK